METPEEIKTRLDALDWTQLRKVAQQYGVRANQTRQAITAAIIEAEMVGAPEEEESGAADSIEARRPVEPDAHEAPDEPPTATDEDALRSQGALHEVIARLGQLQESGLASEELRHALSHAKVANEWLDRRMARRQAAGTWDTPEERT